MTDTALAGVGVLVTRAEHQSAPLVDAIERHGGDVIRLPAIQIRPRDQAEVDSQLGNLSTADIVIFVSPNAVQYGLTYAGDAKVAAVGPATAAALKGLGKPVDIVPAAGFDSEHLLAEAELAKLDGKTVRIIRAQKGRELLGTTLQHRGAVVEYLSVYDRISPDYDSAIIEPVLGRWRDGGIDVVTVMSVETLNNLVNLLDEAGAELIAQTPLVTPAVRVLKEAVERFPGIPVTLADGTDADAIVRAIMDLQLSDEANE